MAAHDIPDVPKRDVRLRRDRRLVVIEINVVDLGGPLAGKLLFELRARLESG